MEHSNIISLSEYKSKTHRGDVKPDFQKAAEQLYAQGMKAEIFLKIKIEKLCRDKTLGLIDQESFEFGMNGYVRLLRSC